MLTLLVLLAAAAAPIGTASSASVTGFADDNAVKVRLHTELEACAGGVVDVEAPTPCDEACAAGLATTAGAPHLLMIEALRVGGDVDVHERMVSSAGTIEHDAHRTVPAAAFEAAGVSPEVCALLKPPAVQEAPPPATTTQLHPAWFVVGGGGLLATIGLVGFGIEAGTLEDPKSSGADKERARVTGSIALGAVFVGVVAAGVAAGIALSE
ncbi:MAG: hypothetical protein Q8O67_23250 [Deltaproteobacteria bacterium]|nr:hypothetical protein [Deltaproteobacteria bacterium]